MLKGEQRRPPRWRQLLKDEWLLKKSLAQKIFHKFYTFCDPLWDLWGSVLYIKNWMRFDCTDAKESSPTELQPTELLYIDRCFDNCCGFTPPPFLRWPAGAGKVRTMQETWHSSGWKRERKHMTNLTANERYIVTKINSAE